MYCFYDLFFDFELLISMIRDVLTVSLILIDAQSTYLLMNYKFLKFGMLFFLSIY